MELGVLGAASRLQDSMKDFDLPAHGIPTDLLNCLMKVADLKIGDELPKDRLSAWWSAELHCMDHRQIERRVALLLSDWRADVDPPMMNIEGHVLTVSLSPLTSILCLPAVGASRISLFTVWSPLPASRSTTVRTTKWVPRSWARQ